MLHILIGAWYLFYFIHSSSYVDYHTMLLICFSLMTGYLKHLFHMLIGHLYSLFGIVPLKFLSIWFVSFFLLTYRSSLYITDNASFVGYMYCKWFLLCVVLKFSNSYSSFLFPFEIILITFSVRLLIYLFLDLLR